MKKILILLFILFSSSSANSLQKAIDNASSGSTIKLSAGKYIGKIIINKPLTIIGIDKNVIIQGNNSGTVVIINSSNVILKNLTIASSGNRMENLDSAIRMKKVNNCIIDNCKIVNSLYGIDMIMVNSSKIINNYITSKDNPISLKGDALKIWYCNNNLIENNKIEYSRDITFTRSHNNKFINNKLTNNRFGLHISLSKNTLVQNNIFKYNLVGIMLMGVKDINIISNEIKSSKGAAGIGVMIKGVSTLYFEKNIVKFNAKGLYIDSTIKEQGMQRYIRNNEISYNGEALHFHEAIKNNTITNNKIFANIEDVVKDVRGANPSVNIIENNYWDRYAGFDRDGDNIGDTSYKVFQYADQLWHYNHKVKFFYASPVMTLMNFLSNLAPFVEPIMLLEDTKPILKVNL